MERTSYQISWEYYDKRHHRRTRELTLYDLDRTVETIKDLKSKLGQPNGPIEVPHVVMFKNGEAKVLNDLM